MEGYVLIHRKIFDTWEWAHDAQVFETWVLLISMANWVDKKWRGREIKRGQLTTSVEHLAEKMGVSDKTVKRCLKCLEATKNIEIKRKSGHNGGLEVTICKYEDYQLKGENITLLPSPLLSPLPSPNELNIINNTSTTTPTRACTYVREGAPPGPTGQPAAIVNPARAQNVAKWLDYLVQKNQAGNYTEQEWLEITAMKNGFNSLEDLVHELSRRDEKSYYAHCIAQGKEIKTLQDTKAHFNNVFKLLKNAEQAEDIQRAAGGREGQSFCNPGGRYSTAAERREQSVNDMLAGIEDYVLGRGPAPRPYADAEAQPRLLAGVEH